MEKLQLIKNNNLKIKTFFSVRIIIFSFTFYTLLYALIKNEWFKVRFNTTNAKPLENFDPNAAPTAAPPDDTHLANHSENHLDFHEIGDDLKNNIGVIREHILQFTIKLFDDIKSELLHKLNDEILKNKQLVMVNKFKNAKLEFENFRDDFTAETKHFIEKIIYENKEEIANIDVEQDFMQGRVVISNDKINEKINQKINEKIKNSSEYRDIRSIKGDIKETIKNVRENVLGTTENLPDLNFDSNNINEFLDMTGFLEKNKDIILSNVTNTLKQKSILHHKDLLNKLSKYYNVIDNKKSIFSIFTTDTLNEGINKIRKKFQDKLDEIKNELITDFLSIKHIGEDLYRNLQENVKIIFRQIEENTIKYANCVREEFTGDIIMVDDYAKLGIFDFTLHSDVTLLNKKININEVINYNNSDKFLLSLKEFVMGNITLLESTVFQKVYTLTGIELSETLINAEGSCVYELFNHEKIDSHPFLKDVKDKITAIPGEIPSNVESYLTDIEIKLANKSNILQSFITREVGGAVDKANDFIREQFDNINTEGSVERENINKFFSIMKVVFSILIILTVIVFAYIVFLIYQFVIYTKTSIFNKGELDTIFIIFRYLLVFLVVIVGLVALVAHSLTKSFNSVNNVLKYIKLNLEISIGSSLKSFIRMALVLFIYITLPMGVIIDKFSSNCVYTCDELMRVYVNYCNLKK
jgi:hypothetical protein